MFEPFAAWQECTSQSRAISIGDGGLVCAFPVERVSEDSYFARNVEFPIPIVLRFS